MAAGLLRGFISILGGRIGAVVIAAVSAPILVRLLGTADYGDYAFMLSTLLLSLVFVNAGIFDGVRKYVAEDRANDRWTAAVFSFYSALALLFAGVAVVVIAVLIRTGVVTAVLGPRFVDYFVLLALILCGKQLFYLCRGGLMGIGREHLSEPLYVVEKGGVAVFGIALAYAGYGVVGVLGGYLLAIAIAACAAAYLLARRIDLRAPSIRTVEAVPRRELVTFNLLTIVLTASLMTMFHVDVLLLRLFQGSVQTGYYKAALMIAEFTWLVPTAIQILLVHSSARMWAQEGSERVTELSSTVTRYTVLFLLLIGIGLAALADSFIPLYFGSAFAPAIVPFLVLLPGALGAAIARPILAIGQGKGELRILVYTTGFAAFLNVSLNLLLIPRYGMLGAAVATSISYGSLLFLHVWAAKRIGFDPTDDLRLARIAATAVVSAPVIVGLSAVISSDIVALLIVPPVGFVVYTALAVKTRALEPDEIRTALERAPGSTGRLVTRF